MVYWARCEPAKDQGPGCMVWTTSSRAREGRKTRLLFGTWGTILYIMFRVRKMWFVLKAFTLATVKGARKRWNRSSSRVGSQSVKRNIYYFGSVAGSSSDFIMSRKGWLWVVATGVESIYKNTIISFLFNTWNRVVNITFYCDTIEVHFVIPRASIKNKSRRKQIRKKKKTHGKKVKLGET